MNYSNLSMVTKCGVLLFSTIPCHSQIKSPNVIIVLTDDLGYNDISCYRNSNFQSHYDGAPTTQTPNVDLLAKQGMRFTDFYCGAAVSSPSRSALMTGRNPTRSGIYNHLSYNMPMHLRNEEITLAELFKTKNYATGHFGKWHLSCEGMGQPLPNDQGFDYSFFTYLNAEPSHHNPDSFFANGKPVGQMNGYACDIVVDEAITWIDKNKKEPFFINIWFNEPHTRIAAPKELAEKHAYNKEYYGAIENMDQALGRLLNYLEKQKLDENTLIIFTSDNGSQKPHSNDPFRGRKCFNLEGGVRAPFIVKWTDNVPVGIVSNMVGSFADIFPTFASLFEMQMPTDRTIDGVDLSSVFLGQNEHIEREKPIFFYRYFHEPICMLREGDWCLLGYDAITMKAKVEKSWSFNAKHMDYLKDLVPQHFELYNLKTDREQAHDLAKKHPTRVEQMKKVMLQLRKEMIEEGGDWYNKEVSSKN